MQHRQDRVGFGEPFQHGVTQHQVVGLGELSKQLLPGCLNEGRGLPGVGEALASAFKHRSGGLGERDLMTALSQPQRHVP
ncbi:hypothetical protein PS685_05331 [Pseudomonas fluorescens]|uniref:Uncharacterized protein n=1 Tax=Pseudomonas fluorescens TaxID=294 RepID=A0A5E7ADN1_PSEFL|nr:hypothetical protein PS685_05331 [Pseudomonas fluorescens]